VTDILLGKGEHQIFLLARYANRHGLVSGATGTGKTVSLLVMAEGLSRIGVPVFVADVKGDVAGLAMPGAPTPQVEKRAREIGLPGFAPEASPVVFWDLYGKDGHPIRTTVSEIGPALFARILELNDVQAGVLDITFRLADEQGLLLLDLDDLRSLLTLVSDKRAEVSQRYGLVSTQSIAAIQRALLRLEGDGKQFFAVPFYANLSFLAVHRKKFSALQKKFKWKRFPGSWSELGRMCDQFALSHGKPKELLFSCAVYDEGIETYNCLFLEILHRLQPPTPEDFEDLAVWFGRARYGEEIVV